MKKKQTILVVEDEIAIRTGLIDVLVYHGFEVDWADNGNDGLNKALSGQFDLILLDVMLPGRNGFDVCNEIRTTNKEQAIIMLTAKSADEDIIDGLTLGADDYITKPFSVAQLILRIKAVLRRTCNNEDIDHITLDNGMMIDTRNLSGQQNGNETSFTRREMDILVYLHQHHERPVNRDELLTKVWGYAQSEDIETRTVDIHIAKLRRKIEDNPSQPTCLITIRGAGYRLVTQ